MKRNDALEGFATTVNNADSNLGKTGNRCFHIGIWGGCGVNCAAFIDGECDIPEEISKQDVIDEHGDESTQILNLYECYKD